jgi:hypothetical protein
MNILERETEVWFACAGHSQSEVNKPHLRIGRASPASESASRDKNMSNTLNPWIRFWFEGNLFFDWINGPEDWQRLRDAYPDYSDERLLAAKRFNGASKPNFGFRMEHKGPGTLKDFFEDNGMEVPK